MESFDAMAMANPIVVTEVSDLPQILDGCGIVLEPDSPEALAEAIETLVEDERLQSELGVNAQKVHFGIQLRCNGTEISGNR